MRLIISILTTLLGAIVSCLASAIYISEVDKSDGVFIYAFIMILGNTFLPILLTTYIYSAIKAKIKFRSKIGRYLSQVLSIALISALGLCLMTISNVISYYSGFSGMTILNLSENFNSRYRGYVPQVILYSFLIPLIYFIVDKYFVKYYNRRYG